MFHSQKRTAWLSRIVWIVWAALLVLFAGAAALRAWGSSRAEVVQPILTSAASTPELPDSPATRVVGSRPTTPLPSPTPLPATPSIPSIMSPVVGADQVAANALRDIQSAPTASAELRAIPLPDGTTGVGTDDAHLLTFRSSASPDEVVNWYTEQLRTAGYRVRILQTPSELSTRAALFVTPTGREGAISATSISTADHDTSVQVIVR